MADGGEDKKAKIRKKFCLPNFTNIMLGLREGYVDEGVDASIVTEDDEQTPGKKKKRKIKFTDEARCVFRTDRCFCSEDGVENSTLQKIAEQLHDKSDDKAEMERLRDLRLKEMSDKLRELYIDHTGSDEPCTELKFRQLILRAIATQLQVACGLSVRMRLTHDEKQVLVAVKADQEDLRVEAVRSKYKMQTHNHPFVKEEESAQYTTHTSAPTFNAAFRKKHEAQFTKSMVSHTYMYMALIYVYGFRIYVKSDASQGRLTPYQTPGYGDRTGSRHWSTT